MTPDEPIYLDYNATTPCDPRVIDKMLPFFGMRYGNAASGFHAQGRLASRALEQARGQVASLINAQPHEIFFTGGATESNNLAILGLARRSQKDARRQIITSAVEHKAVLLPCAKLRDEGFEVVILPVDDQGRVQVEVLAEAVTEQTLLVSIQAANNEIGTIQPIKEIVSIAHSLGAIVHCDAAQAVGKIPVDVLDWGVDLMSASAHKLYGPKGIGCLYVSDAVGANRIEPLFFGGGQERGLRSGTSNVPAAVGFGEACSLSIDNNLANERDYLCNLRDTLEEELLTRIPGIRVHARHTQRLPNTSSMAFPGVDADELLANLPGVMMGTGSACTSGTPEPSHVLMAIGLSRAQAHSTIRASLGRSIGISEVLSAVSLIAEAWKSIVHGDKQISSLE